MRHLSPANSASAGFTLVELLVATAVTGIILTSICGVYFAAASEWERQSGDNTALVAASRACTRIADYASQATGVVIGTRLSASDTLLLNMPSDTAHSGTYAPTWSGDKLQYRSGTWVALYLSDSTGSPYARGEILWAGTVTWAAGSYTISPDPAWSLYYGSTKGRISPIKSVAFALTSSGSRPKVTANVVSYYQINHVEKQLSQSRTVCLRNAN